MPHAPSFLFVLVNKLLSFAMWSSLTPRTTMRALWPCPVMGLGHPRLVTTKLAFSVVGIDFRHFPRCLAVVLPWVSLDSMTAKCNQQGKVYVSTLFVYGVGYSHFGYRSGSLALYLIHWFLFLSRRAHRICSLLLRLLLFCKSDNMLHSPLGFPARISCRIIGCICNYMSLLISKILQSAWYFTYRLLKAVFCSHRVVNLLHTDDFRAHTVADNFLPEIIGIPVL